MLPKHLHMIQHYYYMQNTDGDLSLHSINTQVYYCFVTNYNALCTCSICFYYLQIILHFYIQQVLQKIACKPMQPDKYILIYFWCYPYSTKQVSRCTRGRGSLSASEKKIVSDSTYEKAKTSLVQVKKVTISCNVMAHISQL